MPPALLVLPVLPIPPVLPVGPVSAPVLLTPPPLPVDVELALVVLVAAPVPAAPVPEGWLEQPDPAVIHARTIKVPTIEARPIHRGGETRRAFICTGLLTGQAGAA